MENTSRTPAETWRALIESHRDLIDRDLDAEDQTPSTDAVVIPVFRRSKHRQRLLVTSIAE